MAKAGPARLGSPGMRGTSYFVGFGIGIFFLAGGVALYVAGSQELIEFPGGEAANEIGSANDTLKLIGAIWTGVAAFLLIFFAALRMRAAGKARLAATGARGTLTVRTADQTGTYVNYNPVMKISGELQATGVPSRAVTTKSIVPMTALGRWGLGTDLPVSVNASDPSEFEILWDALPPPLAQTAATTGNGPEPPVEERLATLQSLLASGAVTQAEYDEKRRAILEDL